MAKANSDVLTPQMSYLLKPATLAYFLLMAVLAVGLSNIHNMVFDFLACLFTVHFIGVLCGVLLFKRQVSFYHRWYNLVLDLVPAIFFYFHFYA